ncbi:DEAD/DEAH box helicase family protein [Azotobacter armeniacus]
MYTLYQRAYLAHWLSLARETEQSLTQTIASAKVDMNPHQVDAALFALRSPLSQGVLLADEVGLGKTIEASLVLAQKWAEKRCRLLLIVPATLRKQWSQELADKFALPAIILEAKNFNEARKKGAGNPFDIERAFGQPAIAICSNSPRASNRSWRASSGIWWCSTRRTSCATSTRTTVPRSPGPWKRL